MRQIKFNFNQENEKGLAFEDVITSQFFIDSDGDLCIKHDANSYFVIANSYGVPRAIYTGNVGPKRQIKRIFPIDLNIEF